MEPHCSFPDPCHSWMVNKHLVHGVCIIKDNDDDDDYDNGDDGDGGDDDVLD